MLNLKKSVNELFKDKKADGNCVQRSRQLNESALSGGVLGRYLLLRDACHLAMRPPPSNNMQNYFLLTSRENSDD